MNRFTMPLVVLVFHSLGVFAADPEIAKLKANYETAVARATAPLKEAYEKELRRILERQTKAGNLAAANEANTELESLTGRSAAGSTADAKPVKVNERYFVKRTWATAGGTTFTFLESGAGYRQFKDDKKPFTWKANDAGLIETSGEANSGVHQICFFRFVGANEAYFGTNREAIDDKLTLKK